MRISRQISLVAFGSAVVVLLAVMAVVSPRSLTANWSNLAGVLGIAVVGAGLLAGVQWWAVRHLVEQDRDRLIEHLRLSSDERTARGAHVPRSWLAGLHEVVEQRVSSLRRKLQHAEAEQRSAETRARQADVQHQRLFGVVEAVPDGILLTDAFNEVVLANAAAGRTLRFDPADAAHQRVDTLVNDPTLVAIIKDARRSGFRHPQRHTHSIREDGRTRHYEIVVGCVLNAHEEVDGVITVLHDRTREKELAELKSDFVSGVSHELRTPLSSIKAYIEMLVDGEAEDEQARFEFYNIIQTETNRLSRLIDNMLSISRIESGMVKAQCEPTALDPVIRDVLDIMLPQARAKHIALSVSGAAEGAIVHADPDMLHQALVNLLGNAIKYTPAGGRVTLATQAEAARELVHVSVADSGLGIPVESQPYIFDKFYRVPQHKRLAKGTGLGLNLVKHVVETVHHGRLRVTSEVGRGSTFTITLPQAGQDARAEARNPALV